MPRQRWTTGHVVTVPLGTRHRGYAQMLVAPEYAFFEIRTTEKLEPERVITHPILFRLWVMNHAYTKGRWVKIGSAPVSSALQKPVARFRQDAFTGELVAVINGVERRATRKRCETLECAAVWDPEHVEDRLRDHFAGRPNKWVASLRVK